MFNNLEVLCFVLGQQGGTLYQVAKDLDVKSWKILDANQELMLSLIKKAQALRVKEVQEAAMGTSYAWEIN